MKNKLGILLFCFVSLLLVSVMAQAATLPITLNEVKVDGTELQDSTTATNRLDIERDQDFPVRIELTSTADLDDVEVEVFISGFEHNSRQRISDYTGPFDMDANTTYIKKFDLSLSDLVEEDDYKMRVIVTDRDGDELVQNFNLKLDVPRHSIVIEDVIFSPEGYIKAGRALLATVRVANRGEKDEEGVRVKVTIPSLGVSASDYVEEVEKEGDDDDEVTSEELYLRIPVCAEAGTYDVNVEVRYNDGFDVVTQKTVLEVLKDDTCPGVGGKPAPSTDRPQTVINVGTVSQDVTAGVGGATYPITLTNGGTSSRTYTVGVSGVADFGSASVTPTNTVVLANGETQTMYVYVSANSGTQAGQRQFGISVSSGDKVLKQVPLTANVLAGSSVSGGLKKALEIGLVILVVLLVILGLIIGFNKLKGSDQEGEESQTYY